MESDLIQNCSAEFSKWQAFVRNVQGSHPTLKGGGQGNGQHKYRACFITGGPKDLIEMRIIDVGSKAHNKGDSRSHRFLQDLSAYDVSYSQYYRY